MFLSKHAQVSNIQVKGNSLPYITAEVRQLARQRDYLTKKADKAGSRYLRQAFQQIKHKITYKVRKLTSEYYSKKIAENQGDIKATWKVLKEVMKTEPKQSYFSVISGNKRGNKEDVTDKLEILERLNDHFVSLGEKLASYIPSSSSSSLDCISKVKTNGAKFKFKIIKPTDVYNILSKLKNGKATGMHLIPNKILKSVKEIMANSLSDVFNVSILTKIFPDDLRLLELHLFLRVVKLRI